MRVLLAALIGTAVAVRVVRSRHRRFLHPDGRSFTGEVELTGADTGSHLLDRPKTWPATVRISRGVGRKAGRGDILGVAIRVRGCDLLFSTAGRGRFTRHLPMPRRSFDTFYGSILAYRTGSGRKIYLAVEPDPDGRPLGITLESVTRAARHDGAVLRLTADDHPAGVVRFGLALPAGADAALAFDPVRNTTADLHPTGLVHASRAAAYRLSQRWRGAGPAAADPGAVARTAAHA